MATTMEPPQVPADYASPTSSSQSVQGMTITTTATYTTPKKTSGGATGSVTFSGGKVTSHTPSS